MTNSFIAVFQRTASDSDAVFQKYFSLGNGKGISLQSVAGIGKSDTEIIIQRFYFFLCQWPGRGYFLFIRVCFLQQFMQ